MATYMVVGAAGGVGMQVVRLLKEQGATVMATVMNTAEAERFEAVYPGSTVYELDLSVPEDVYAKLSCNLTEQTSIDGVVVCAAISPIGPIESTDLSTFRSAIEVNYLSNVAIYQAVLPALRKSAGRLILISSMAGKVAMPFIGAYSASKYALEAIGDVMRREAAPQGITVSLIEPGGIRTPMVDAQLQLVAEKIGSLTPQEESKYGYLYRGFHQAAAQSNQSTASSPEEVAAIVVKAMTEKDPAPRYIAGAEAEQMIGASKVMSDVELDGMMAQFMDGAG